MLFKDAFICAHYNILFRIFNLKNINSVLIVHIHNIMWNHNFLSCLRQFSLTLTPSFTLRMFQSVDDSFFNKCRTKKSYLKCLIIISTSWQIRHYLNDKKYSLRMIQVISFFMIEILLFSLNYFNSKNSLLILIEVVT